jgi:hypothetical protein
MNESIFNLYNYDGCMWWKHTISVCGLENIMVYVKVRNLNDLEFLYHLEKIGAVQM